MGQRMDRDPTIRVLIVEDQRMIADLLSAMLAREDDIEVVGWARTASEARAQATAGQPDVVLMDFRLPDGDGIAVTRQLREDHEDVAVVMVTAAESDTVLTAALQAGCSGYITKGQSSAEVVAAVRTAHEGGSTIAPELLARALPRLSGRTSGSDRSPLTPRQLQVLQLLARGSSTSEIADQLGVSPNTVRNHTQAVLTRLDAHSKLEAVAVARREGLLAPLHR